MEKYRYREIEKNLPSEFEQIAFSITGNVRKQGFNKYEFKYIREKIYQEAEKLMLEKVSKDVFIKKLNQVADKYLSKGLKKTPLENVTSILFVVFLIVSVCLPFIYGINFNKNPEDYPIFASGLDINVSLSSVFYLVLYFGLGLGVALLMQKMDTKKKVKVLVIVSLLIIALLTLISALTAKYPGLILSFNIIISELVMIALTFGCYYIEDIIAKKGFEDKYSNPR